MVDWQEVAAANNAALCDAVARTHDLRGVFARDAWTSPTRTPPLYPDAVTLAPEVEAVDVLERIDGASGASIKDSFASLDLGTHGFDVLFDARWIATRIDDTRVETPVDWFVVETLEQFAKWEVGWRGATGPVGVLRPSLLQRPDVTVVAREHGTGVVAGALFNRSDAVVGVSNLFTGTDAEESWRGCRDFAHAIFGAAVLVGYARDADLDAALACGFTDVGPLRVWLR
jgi:hypothetical protein